ncbi:MAG TPA: alkaline phosphatase family protein [Myxococcota bacterium]
MRAPALRVVVAALAAALFAVPAAATKPKLGVLLVFDQLPMWLLERYEPFFGRGGFGGLDGATYSAFYPYAGTETAPGHATLSTCAAPAVHGIATNTWFHEGKPQYVTDDPAYPLLAPTASDPSAKANRGASPRMLLVPTLGDAVKAESAGAAKVITLSHKDRAAVLTAGQSADLAVWYDVGLGRYTSSTAYVEKLPDWLVDQGAMLPLAARTSATWEPLPIPRGLEHLVPKDDRPGEAEKAFTRVFPHHLKDVADDDKRKSAYRLIPQGNDDLYALALLAVEHEGLGTDDVTDLLVVSVSTTDLVGHIYGGDSLEQLDTLRRADQSLRRFITALKAKVGHDVVFALSSDHGAPELPATIAASGITVPSIAPIDIVEAADAALKKAAPRATSRVQGFYSPQLFIDFAGLDDTAQTKAIAAVREAVQALPAVAHVYDMRLGRPDEDAFHHFMRQSAPPSRAASVFVRLQPRVVLMEERGQTTGTDHGTPYTYDRRVPLIVSGPGVRRGRYSEPADVRDVAASLAFLMQVPPPDACQGKPVSAVGAR